MFKETVRTDKRGSKKSLVFGVGNNDAPYQTAINIEGKIYLCPYYSKWVSMIARCYSKKYVKNNPTYEKCEVVKEWHSFMAFRKWMETQDWKDKQLDKDLLSFGKKVYSPQTCLFVTPQVNSLFGKGNFKKSELPIGIYKRKDKYEVGVSSGESVRTWVGSYKTLPEAIDAYIKAKTDIVKKVVKETKDTRTKQAILAYLVFFTDNLTRLKNIV